MATHLRHLVNGLLKMKGVSEVAVVAGPPGAGAPPKAKDRGKFWERRFGKKRTRNLKPPDPHVRDGFSGRGFIVGTLYHAIAGLLCEEAPGKNVVLHVHDFDGLVPAVLARDRFKCPLVMTVHRGFGMFEDAKARLDEKDAALAAASRAKLVDMFVVPSVYSEEYLLKLGVPKERIRVIRHGISGHLSRQRSDDTVKERFGILGHPGPIALCPVRCEGSKDPQTVMLAALALKDSLPNLKFVFTSLWGEDKQLEQVLVKQAQECPGTVSLGSVVKDPREMATLYRAADVVVIPSLYESFGLVAIEAFSFGRPVLARRSGALPEIVKYKQNGLTFFTSGDLAGQLRDLFSGEEGRRELGRLGQEAARTWRRSFGREEMAQAYLNLFAESVVKKKMGRRP